MKIRDKGIDFLMFIAVLLVVNSHLDQCIQRIADFWPQVEF